MTALVILFTIAVAIIAALVRLLVRAARRLMQYDDMFQRILPVVESYGSDLREMSSGNLDGVLTDHPEILAFHRRNLLAKEAIESIVDSVRKMTPARRKPPALPRPDME